METLLVLLLESWQCCWFFLCCICQLMVPAVLLILLLLLLLVTGSCLPVNNAGDLWLPVPDLHTIHGTGHMQLARWLPSEHAFVLYMLL
jgi:hypothetical protein